MDEIEEARFPEEFATSVKKSSFHVIENRDMSLPEEVERLLRVMFDHPERAFYLFVQKGASFSNPIGGALGSGDVLAVQTDLLFYRHPKFDRDFVRIGLRSELFDWEREALLTQEYIRFTLKLSERKRREMEVSQHLAAHAARSSSPLKLEPNIYGVGVDLRKLWASIRKRLPW
jgi:hypothetical protein